MENNQVKKLKINVINIKSSLFKSNKELIRLKKEKVKLFFTQQTQSKISKKEKSLESASSFKQSVANIGQKLISGPLSLVDKFKEFFGLILLGVLVNNLPTIVKKLQDVFGKIKDFLDGNPWIMDAVKFGFKIIGEGIMGLAKLIKFVKPYIGGSFKFALDTIKSTKNQIGSLITTFDELDLAFGGLIKDLNVDKIPDPNKDAAKYSSFVAGGGKAALEKKGQTVDEVIEQGKKNISGYDTKPRQPTPGLRLSPPGSMYPANPPTQKFAKGGTIKSDKTKPTTTTTSRTPFARPGGTAMGRKTIEKANAFGVFKRNVEDQISDQKDQKKNYNLMEELLKKFKELQKLRGKEKSDDGGGGGGGGGAPGGQFTGSAADIPPEGKALLDAIAGAEAGGYNARYPSKTFNNGYKDHPRIPEPTPDGRTSDAAGRYQFLSSTWDQYKPAKAFTPENQDVAAWKLATAVYGYGESGIVKDLQKDPMKVADKLKGTWPSLPGGSQTNTHTSGFLSRYKVALKKYKELTISATRGSLSMILPQGDPRSGSGFRTMDRPRHNGLDIPVDANSPVMPLESGKVVDIYRDFGDWGDAVVVEHADKTKTVYGHIIPTVKKGDLVVPTAMIGKVKYWPRGKAGAVFDNNTHLHLERIVGGTYVNPAGYLNNLYSQRQKATQKTDPRAKLEPGKIGPVLPTNIEQSIKADTPDVGLLRTFAFKARNGKTYRVEFGQFFEGIGLNASFIPVNTSATKNKWLIDDYNKAVEQYQLRQQSNGNQSSISPLQQKGIQVTPKSSEIASTRTSPITNTVVLTKTRYVVQPIVT